MEEISIQLPQLKAHVVVTDDLMWGRSGIILYSIYAQCIPFRELLITNTLVQDSQWHGVVQTRKK